jgi:hypothetical protein
MAHFALSFISQSAKRPMFSRQQGRKMTDHKLPIARGDREASPTPNFPGNIQIERGGRCFSISANTAEARSLVEAHAAATISGHPLPEYAKRWQSGEREA